MQRFDSATFEEIWKWLDEPCALVAPDGKWLKVNPALCRALQYTEEQLLQKTFQEITWDPQQLRDDLTMVEILKEGRSDEYTMVKFYRGGDDMPVKVRLHVRAMRDQTNNLMCFFSQIHPLVQIRHAGVLAPGNTDTPTIDVGIVVGKFLSDHKVAIGMILSAAAAVMTALSALIGRFAQ